ncbi:hypothetical protein KY333_01180 [Candidatus Woesearchaeota archaeon]|nr:hypothetical protein [Candidatus Woesearchaeota archaeon]
MSKESKYDTRAIAEDLIAGMIAVHESCSAIGCEPQEAHRYIQSFKDSELKDLGNSELAERVSVLSQNPHMLYFDENSSDGESNQNPGYFSIN